MLDVAHQYQQATDWHLRAPPAFAEAAQAAMMSWEIVIGLETHAQLTTRSKIFSGASTAFGAAPNTQASAVDIALPGVLPVLNRGAVERAIRFGLAVGGDDRRRARSSRARTTSIPTSRRATRSASTSCRSSRAARSPSWSAARRRRVRLTRAHLEEDAGKSLHEDFHGATGIDLNRAGTPLLEIVSEPDMRSSGRGGRLRARRCTRWCAGSASATATCRKARSAAMPTSRCGRPGRTRSARAARSRTSTPSASSSTRSSSRCAARSS